MKVSFLNSQGFSLVQVLVALGLSGLVGIGIAQLMTDSARLQQTVRQRSEADDAVRLISGYLADDIFCTANLITVPSQGAGLTLDKIKAGIKISNLSNMLPDGTIVELFSVNNKKGFSSAVRLNEVRLGLFENNESKSRITPEGMLAEISLQFEADSTLGGGVATKSIPLRISLNSGTATSCQLHSAIAGALKLDDCAAGKFVRGVNSQGQLICDDFPASSCTAPSYVSGIDSRGHVICSLPPEPEYKWVPRKFGASNGSFMSAFSPTGESYADACKRVGMTPVPSGSGVTQCASGEARAHVSEKMPADAPINYRFGVWGNDSTLIKAFVSGNYCYRNGQKHDNDRTDVTVAYLCKEK